MESKGGSKHGQGGKGRQWARWHQLLHEVLATGRSYMQKKTLRNSREASPSALEAGSSGKRGRTAQRSAGKQDLTSAPTQSYIPSPVLVHAVVAIYKMRMKEQCCTLAPPVSEGSFRILPSVPKTKQEGHLQNNTQDLFSVYFYPWAYSCCCFTATSAPILAQTLLLEPSNISQWVMCTFRPLQKTLMSREEDIYLCFPRTALAERLRNNRLWPQEDTNPTFTRVLKY